MLDVRASHYVSPLSEVEFTDVPLTVHLVNGADEAALISGRFRVYNDTTHELIFDSLIAPLTLTKGQEADVSALTDFSPPAPLDDTYFVLFDGKASNYLVPRGIPVVLGAFYFDVKPGPLGDPPAAHAPTHVQAGADPIETEDLGTAELDTDLRLGPDGAGGVLWTTAAAAGAVPAHAASHEDGGADELEVSDLATAELDDTLVLQPDGAGGVEWAAAPGGVTDHGALTGLADDDHPQYQLRHQVHFRTEFLQAVSSTAYPTPWASGNLSGGSVAIIAGEASHPGIVALTCAASANSGARVYFDPLAILLQGGEETLLWFRIPNVADTVLIFGFHDSGVGTAPADGAYIYLDNTDNKIDGRTADVAGSSTTGTDYAIAANTWYCAKIVVNANATRVDFYLYNAAGAQVWTDNLTTNIPTAAGDEVGHGVVAITKGTTGQEIAHLDYLDMTIPDTRPTL